MYAIPVSRLMASALPMSASASDRRPAKRISSPRKAKACASKRRARSFLDSEVIARRARAASNSPRACRQE